MVASGAHHVPWRRQMPGATERSMRGSSGNYNGLVVTAVRRFLPPYRPGPFALQEVRELRPARRTIPSLCVQSSPGAATSLHQNELMHSVRILPSHPVPDLEHDTATVGPINHARHFNVRALRQEGIIIAGAGHE